MSIRSIDHVTFASTLYQHSQMPSDETELKDIVKKAALVVENHPTLEVREGAIDYHFQFDMIVIDFDKNLENLHLIVGDEIDTN
jgi:hypothetical protein